MNSRSSCNISVNRIPTPLNTDFPSMLKLPDQTFLPVTGMNRCWEGLRTICKSPLRSASSEYRMNAPPTLMLIISPSMEPLAVTITTGQFTGILGCRRFSTPRAILRTIVKAVEDFCPAPLCRLLLSPVHRLGSVSGESTLDGPPVPPSQWVC
jgi:hypothetical protein